MDIRVFGGGIDYGLRNRQGCEGKMSWDFTVVCLPCRECGSVKSYSWDGCTYNLYPMWKRAGIEPNEFNGGLAKDWAPRFRAAIKDMETHPEIYRALNPSNGWGDFDKALPLIKELTEFLETYPEATIRVN